MCALFAGDHVREARGVPGPVRLACAVQPGPAAPAHVAIRVRRALPLSRDPPAAAQRAPLPAARRCVPTALLVSPFLPLPFSFPFLSHLYHPSTFKKHL